MCLYMWHYYSAKPDSSLESRNNYKSKESSWVPFGKESMINVDPLEEKRDCYKHLLNFEGYYFI